MNPTFDYWTPTVITTTKFNIVDMIKGIVPSHLFFCINNFTNCNKKTTTILFNFFEHIQTQAITLIWIPRCDLTIAAELQIGITKKKKLYTKAPKIIHNPIPSSSLVNTPNTYSSTSKFTNLFYDSYIHGRSWPLFKAVKTSCLFLFSLVM
jgi:hypothetical protein